MIIIDVTGTLLIPGNGGRDCPGNGKDQAGECCCDECDYLICCLDTHDMRECETCLDADCARGMKRTDSGI